jgi:hypothetical protein
MHHRNIAYLIADSVHARFVVWDRDAGDYRTVVKVHDGPAPPPRHQAGPGPDDRGALRAKIRSAFAEVLAQQVRHFAAERSVEGFVLAAPARLLTPLKAALKDGPPILGAVAKDLTKQADHELREWLLKAEEHALA